MSKLAWYVVIMVAIDVLLCLARFCEKASKNAKKDNPPSEGTAPRGTDTASVPSDASANSPSA